MPERLLSIETLADQLSVSSRTVARMVSAKLLPRPVQVSPGRVAWPESEVVAFIDERKAARGQAN